MVGYNLGGFGGGGGAATGGTADESKVLYPYTFRSGDSQNIKTGKIKTWDESINTGSSANEKKTISPSESARHISGGVYLDKDIEVGAVQTQKKFVIPKSADDTVVSADTGKYLKTVTMEGLSYSYDYENITGLFRTDVYTLKITGLSFVPFGVFLALDSWASPRYNEEILGLSAIRFGSGINNRLVSVLWENGDIRSGTHSSGSTELHAEFLDDGITITSPESLYRFDTGGYRAFVFGWNGKVEEDV